MPAKKKILQLLLLLIFNFSFAQQAVYEILNTSVNTRFAEFGVTYTGNNSVIFASSKNDKNGKRKNNRQLSLELYKGMIMENGDIIQTGKFSSEVNNKFFESDISFSPDFKTIYFTWNNFYSPLKLKEAKKFKTLRLYKAAINEKFDTSKITPLPFNSEVYSVRCPEVNKDGTKLYFVSDMPGGFGGMDVYVAEINSDGSFGEPKNLGPNVNTKKDELYPFLDQNNTLYFASDGHTGRGKFDIYKSEFSNYGFGPAINLPAPFNTKYDDFAYVSENGSNSGYFTSNRDKGEGNVDIYAFKTEVPECSQTINFITLNSETDEALSEVAVSLFLNNKLVKKQIIENGSNFKFNINCNETYKILAEKENYESEELFFTTNDKNNSEIKKTLRLLPSECNQYFSGKISVGKINQALGQVTVSLFQNNKLLEKQITNNGEGFKFNLSCSETYKLVAEIEHFETLEFTITTDDKNKAEIAKTLKLTPIACTQLLRGSVTDSKTNLPLPNAMVSIFKGKELLAEISLDATATFAYKLKCDIAYRIAFSLKGYNNLVTTIKTAANFDEDLDLKFQLEASEEFVKVNGHKMIKINPIYFDLNSSYLNEEAFKELDKVVEIMQKYPNLIIECGSHTDARASSHYNDWLSERRAKRTVDYIISKGISPERISGKGYGETQLLNHCASGVICSEANHQKNRRTEFIIVAE